MSKSIVDIIMSRASEIGLSFLMDNEKLKVRIPRNVVVDHELLLLIEENKELIKTSLRNDPLLHDRKPARRIERMVRNSAARLPLSFAQERLWFIDRLQGSAQYNLHWIFRLRGNLDVRILESCFRDIINRHEVLRTVIAEEDGIPYQQICTVADWNMHYTDQQSIVYRGKTLEEYIEAEISRSFDLSADVLLRITLIRTQPNEHLLIAVIHHIAFDGWSVSVLVQELSRLYKAKLTGQPVMLKDLSLQYADYSAWQRRQFPEEQLKQHLLYWKTHLSGVERLHLLPDHKGPAEKSIRGSVVNQKVERTVRQALAALSHREGVTLFMTLLAAFKVLLQRYSGQQDICIGSPVAGRDFQEVEEMIGFFVNMLVLRTNCDPNNSFRDFLQHVKQTTLQAYDHGYVPFERIVETLDLPRDVNQNPFYEVVFAFHNTPEPDELYLGDVMVKREKPGSVSVQFDLVLHVTEVNGELQLEFVYNTDMYRADTIHRMLELYGQLLNNIIKHADLPLSRLKMLSPVQEQRLLEDFSHPRSLFAADTEGTVLQLIATAAIKIPDAIAVVDSTTQLSYQQLQEQSNQLALFVQQQGVGLEEPVVVCMERSAALITAMLAIWKAGAAYVPVDPSYPAARINHILKDTGARIVLVSNATASLIEKDENVKIINIQATEWKDGVDGKSLSDKQPTGPGLAYVIYTSGSTGVPKGVMIEHKGILNLVRWHHRAYQVQPESRSTCMSAIGFDAFGWEVWPYLAAGATLYVPADEVRLDSELLSKYLTAQNITHCFCATALVESLVEAMRGSEGALQYLLTGGDRLGGINTKGLPYKLINNYGPTENTVVATSYLV
ncbi:MULTISPECIES: non-ribosomal peptide synthetase, partial [Niastella]